MRKTMFTLCFPLKSVNVFLNSIEELKNSLSFIPTLFTITLLSQDTCCIVIGLSCLSGGIYSV